MRAIAVIAVLTYHADKSVLSGGFLGVDMFFVISGYLITSIMHKGCLSGTFSLAGFYQRRISRIFPVFFLVLISILLGAHTFFNSQDFASAGALATATALSATNFKLMLQGSYFEMSPDSQPFLHFWSLSVEEQFYVFLPLLFVASQRWGLSRKFLFLALGGLFLMSLSACVLMAQTQPSWAFYLLRHEGGSFLPDLYLRF